MPSYQKNVSESGSASGDRDVPFLTGVERDEEARKTMDFKREMTRKTKKKEPDVPVKKRPNPVTRDTTKFSIRYPESGAQET